MINSNVASCRTRRKSMTDTRKTPQRSVSILTKLISYFLIISIIPLIVLGVFAIRLSTNPLREFALTPLQRHTLSLANHIREELYDAREDVLYASRLPDLARMLEYLPESSPEEQVALKEPVYNDFIELVRKRKKYRYISYCNTEGNELVRVNFLGINHWQVVVGDRLQNKRETTFFQEGLSRPLGQVFVSEVKLNEEYGILQQPYTKVLYISTPVEDLTGKKRGVITIALMAETLFKPVREWNVDRYSQASHFIINKKGFYIAHSDKTKEWGTQQYLDMKWSIINDFTSEVSKQLLNNTQNAVIESDANVFITHRMYPEPNNPDKYWILTSFVPREVIYRQIRNFKLIFLTLLIVTIITTVVFAAILSIQFIRPIRTLRNGASVIRSGNLSHRIELKSSDELGELAYDFNLMTSQLEELYQNLENKVKERTEELRRAMSNLEEKDKQLREANQLKLDFLTNLSSELRTPLTSIMGYLALLINNVYGDLNEKQNAALQKARKNVYHTFKWLDGIIRISSLSAIENDQVSVHPQKFNLTDSVATSIKNLSYVLTGEEQETLVTFNVAQKNPIFSDKEKVDEVISSVLNGIVYHQRAQNVPIIISIDEVTVNTSPMYAVSFVLTFDKSADITDLHRALVEPFIHSPTFFNITNLSTNVARSLLAMLEGELQVDYDKKTNTLHVRVYLKKGEE